MKLNRQTLLALAGVAVALSILPLVRAADTNQPPPPPQPPQLPPAGGVGRFGAMRERMQDLAKELNLTDEQKQKLQAIIREQMEKLQGLRQDNSLSREEKMEKVKAAREEINAAARLRCVRLSSFRHSSWGARNTA